MKSQIPIVFRLLRIEICFFNESKKAKCLSLAPIEVKILVSRVSAHKIVADSGTIFPKMPNLSALKNKIKYRSSVLIKNTLNQFDF